jgi:CRP-like cAMP-binding protein
MTKQRDRTLDEFLDDSAWFARLPAATQQRVRADTYCVRHDHKGVVGRVGESVLSWIGVIDGLLKVTVGSRQGKAVIYTSIPAGSWMGEGSVSKDEERHYDVIAIGETRTAHVPRATFRWLLDSSLEFNHFIIEQLNARLAQMMAALEVDRLTDHTERVSSSICGLFDPVLYPQMKPFLHISQLEFGELAGLSRQATNAALRELSEQGLVSVQYGGLTVLDLRGLRALAKLHE